MTKKIVVVAMALIVLGCQRKSVQLSKVCMYGQEKIDNYSTVYIFFNEKNKQAELNKNNLISTTNWVLHIDKRNSFDNVAEIVEKLQEKKQNPLNPHSNPEAKMVVSVSDTAQEKAKLKFIDFTNVRFLDAKRKKLDDKPVVRVAKKSITVDEKEKKMEKMWESYNWTFEQMTFQEFISQYVEITKKGIYPKKIVYEKKTKL